MGQHRRGPAYRPSKLKDMDIPMDTPQEAPVKDIIRAVRTPPVAARPAYTFCGMPVSVTHSRRPRINRVEASKPRSRGRELGL
jgi:hypothetical protein